MPGEETLDLIVDFFINLHSDFLRKVKKWSSVAVTAVIREIVGDTVVFSGTFVGIALIISRFNGIIDFFPTCIDCTENILIFLGFPSEIRLRKL